ncbi:MAG TPA: hypothetical protein VMD59_01455, partial [Acidimicrobiales bacterium]|nr:hypothetical protein [Acidimicrobiales bacterium]
MGWLHRARAPPHRPPAPEVCLSPAAGGDVAAFTDAGGWAALLHRLFHRQDLTAELAGLAFEEILEGRALPEQIAAFAAALRTKGETVEELSGFVASMLRHASLVEVGGELVDTCGTGGDRS